MLNHQINKFEVVLSETMKKKEIYENNILELEEVVNYLKSDLVKIKDNDSIETIILKSYIEQGGIKPTCDYINDMGYRIPSSKGERKYTVKDISCIISELDSDSIDNKLKEIINSIYVYRSNSKYGKLVVKEY